MSRSARNEGLYVKPARKPPDYTKRTRKPKISETDEHKAVADFLATCLGGTAFGFHIRNERVTAWDRIQAARMGMKSGIPDFEVVDGGRAFFIEMKPLGWRSKKSHTPHEERQITIHNRLRLARCPVATCETLDEVMEFLRQHGVPLRVSER